MKRERQRRQEQRHGCDNRSVEAPRCQCGRETAYSGLRGWFCVICDGLS